MQKLTKYHKRIKLTFIASAFCCCFLFLFLFNSVGSFAASANYYEVMIAGQTAGSSNSLEKAELALKEARARLSSEAESIVFVDASFRIEPKFKAFAKTDSVEELSSSIYKVLMEYTDTSFTQAVMLSSGDYYILVDSTITAAQVLSAMEKQVDPDDEYTVTLTSEKIEDFTQITYKVEDSASMEQKIVALMEEEGLSRSAASSRLHKTLDIGFVDDLEIRNVYTDRKAVLKGNEAVEKAVADNGIGIRTSYLANYDEEFYAPTEYMEDSKLYEGRTELEREAVPGQRNVDAVITSVNGAETGRQILSQMVTVEPVAEIIRTGTLPPPDFVVPLENCFLSSGFGYRWGALHQGNDYACSYGEPIFASCPGVVESVVHSWEGYGNCVIIRHDDHIKTRYAHMSETACEEGQQVSRYDVIGYAGSTGNSTGVHCHFEIIVDGVAVDPFTFLEG